MKWTVAVALVLALPLWLVGQPAMPDYPAHLASYWLIAGGASPFYHVHWAFIPNLAGEIVVPPLSKLFGVDAAARFFISLGVVLWVVGPALIQRALHGRVGVAAAFAALFAYNANFTWGFLNYYFAMGAGFVFFAAWIASDKRAWHLACFALAATAIYFCHLFALAVLVLTIAGWELRSRRPYPQRLGAIAVTFAPAALAFALLKPVGDGTGGLAFDFLDTALDKAGAAIQLTYDNPSFVLLGLLAVLFASGLWQGWIKVHERMRVPLLLVGIATVLAPEWAMGGWAVHMRLPAVFGALLFASSAFELEARARLALAGAAVLALLCNVLALAHDWRDTDAQYAEFRDVARRLPKGKRLMTVLDGDAIGWRSDQPYWHMAEFAAIDAQAFTPLLFTTRGQHVVQLDAADRAIAAATAQQGSPPDIDELDDLAQGKVDEDEDIRNVFPYLMRFQCRYDVAVVVHLNGPRARVPDMLSLRHAGSFFSLYDVKRDASCAR
ncbi:MAG: hypothetical protein JOZ72_17620 [Alphaproteobacteria bacterium]|nr:hypothetical protein [Alphaproteobacteria bacterium]